MKHELQTANGLTKRRAALLLMLLSLAFFVSLVCSPAHAQKLYVSPFKGDTIGAKLEKAQSYCVGPSIPCVLEIEPQLAAYSLGTLPAKCAQCQWIDYSGKVGGSDSEAATYLNAAKFPGNDASEKIHACLIATPYGCDARSLTGAQTLSTNIFAGISKPVRVLFGAAEFAVLTTQKPDSDTTITCEANGATRFIGNLNAPLFQSSDPTVRKYRINYENCWCDNTSTANANGVCWDYTNVSTSELRSPRSTNVKTAIKIHADAGKQASWLDIFAPQMQGDTIIKVTEVDPGSANEIHVYGGSLNNGVDLVDLTGAGQPNISFFATGFESWTNSVIKGGANTTAVNLYGGRFEHVGAAQAVILGNDGQGWHLAPTMYNGFTNFITAPNVANPKWVFIDPNAVMKVGAGNTPTIPASLDPKLWVGRAFGIHTPSGSSHTPFFIISRGQESADERLWTVQADNKQLAFKAMNDAFSGATAWLTVNRGTGTAITNVTIGAPFALPAIKANSGTRYVCIDANGILVSQTTACSGT